MNKLDPFLEISYRKYKAKIAMGNKNLSNYIFPSGNPAYIQKIGEQ